MSTRILTLAFCIAVTSQQSFVDSAPVNEEIPDTALAQDSSVRELENLKHPISTTLEMMKSQSTVYRNNNGQQETHAERKAEVNANGNLLARINQHIDIEPKLSEGKPLAKVQTDIEVPAKGIHKTVVQQLPTEYQTLTENGNRRSAQETGNNVDNSLTGTQYSPLDMAEYVFWTGDEKGVTLAIEEFLQEGLMSQEEAISFLQEIKYNLDYLKNHYTQLGLNAKEGRKPEVLKYQMYTKARPTSESPELRNNFNLNQLRQEASKKHGAENSPKAITKLNETPKDVDYEELLERLRLADFLYTEYSLEEVIYQLAKVMFTQSLTHGSAEAQQALQKFTNFLEAEAEQGRISRTLEKKVLDVLIASLSDTLSEHPELLPAADREAGSNPNADGQHFLRQILEISPDDKAAVRAAMTEYPQGRNLGHAKEIKMPNQNPMGIGKYKNP